MLLFSLSTPFPSLPTLYPLPPTPRCRLRLRLHLSPPYPTSITTTAAAATPVATNNDFMVDYLVDSLGFTTTEAISASTQVSHLKSPQKPKSFINFFLKYGLNKTQIRLIVSSSPKILLHKVKGNLEPKIKFFLEEIGFSTSDLVKLIIKHPAILSKGLDTCIKPTFRYLKEVMGSDELVVPLARDLPWLLSSPSSLRKMQLNVEMLRDYGFKDEDIRKSITRNPSDLMRKPEKIRDALSRLDKELGIPHDSGMLFTGVFALASVDKETLQMKFKIFRSYGWTDSEIMKMSRSQPSCLTISESKIRRVLNFLMKELGYTPEYLASHACLMMYSMDKRVKPRYEVLKILKENKLVKNKPGLYSLVIAPESKFIDKYVLRFEDELPNLHEIYRNSIKPQSKDQLLCS